MDGGDDSITSDSQELPRSISPSPTLPQPSLPSPIPRRSALSSPVTSRYSNSLPVGPGIHHPLSNSWGPPFRRRSLLTPPFPDEGIFYNAQKINQILNEENMSSGASSSENLDSLEIVSGTSSGITPRNGPSPTPLENPSSHDIEFGRGEGKKSFDSMASCPGGGHDFLIQSNIFSTPFVDFYHDIRPMLDAKHLFSEISVVLDLDSISLSDIVDSMLLRMFPKDTSPFLLDDVRQSIFVDPMRGTMFTDFMQGASSRNDASGHSTTSIDSTWIAILATVPGIRMRKVGIARLRTQVNFGLTAPSVSFVVLILSPTDVKATKSPLETGRTIGTLLSNIDVRYELKSVRDEESFRNVLISRSLEWSKKHSLSSVLSSDDKPDLDWNILSFGSDLMENFKRRSGYYISDYLDAFDGFRAISKVTSTTIFLFFSVILPTVAFGSLAHKNTEGLMNENRAVMGQIIGGLLWAILAGQPMLIIATTALVSLYSKVVFDMSVMMGVNFYTLYAWVGIWAALFLFIYAFCGVSNLIKYSTRSVEEIFTLFITVCFTVDAIGDIVHLFRLYWTDSSGIPESNLDIADGKGTCLLSLLLMLATVFISLLMYGFRTTAFFVPFIRDTVSDYALPAGVIISTLIGVYVFPSIHLNQLGFDGLTNLNMASLSAPGGVIGISCALGFALSILFFMDQNITSQILNSPVHRLKKGAAPHLDILWLGVINLILSLFGLPWMHAILPHSPLHVYGLAEVEEKVVDGQVRTVIVEARETRVTGITCHILMGVILGLLPKVFKAIPVPVLNGLFLYCAVASMRGNSLVERVLLFFTQQSMYPPSHVVRRCPQSTIHWFTFIELAQLLLICFVGFFPETYLQMFFPVAIAILIPIRYLIVPLFVKEKYLDVLESFH